MILQLNAPYAPVCMAYALLEFQSSRAFFLFQIIIYKLVQQRIELLPR